jgi:NitT/TauT family transport system substrate-binding protein
MHRKIGLALAFLLAVVLPGQALAKAYKVAWSHYTGWEPWGYAAEQGIIKKWADKYGVEIEVTLVNDYIESVNLYTSGTFDAVAVTNMDALSIPCVGGVDTTALILGDFSNGNDGIVIKGGKAVSDLKGRSVKLVELSVSHYLLARALDKAKLSERDIKIVNTSDADIGAVFASGGPTESVVTWNPILMSIRNTPGANLIFDSSSIPGGTVAEFKAQLKTTAMFYKPSEGVELARSEQLKATMQYVAKFSFDHGLYGERAKSADLVGIQFPDGKIQGDPKNVKLRFDATFMELAAQGKL